MLKKKICEPFRICLLNSTANSAQFWWKWAGLAVLFSRQLLNSSQDFFFVLRFQFSFIFLKYKTIETSSCIASEPRTNSGSQIRHVAWKFNYWYFFMTQTLAGALASNSLLLGFQCEFKMIVCTCIGKRGSFFLPKSFWLKSILDCFRSVTENHFWDSFLKIKVTMLTFSWKLKVYRRLYSRDPLSLNRAISLVEIYVIQTGEIKSPRFGQVSSSQQPAAASTGAVTSLSSALINLWRHFWAHWLAVSVTFSQ
jgi:hypothetical protein